MTDYSRIVMTLLCFAHGVAAFMFYFKQGGGTLADVGVRKVAPLFAGVVVSLLPFLLRNCLCQRDEASEQDGTEKEDGGALAHSWINSPACKEIGELEKYVAPVKESEVLRPDEVMGARALHSHQLRRARGGGRGAKGRDVLL